MQSSLSKPITVFAGSTTLLLALTCPLLSVAIIASPAPALAQKPSPTQPVAAKKTAGPAPSTTAPPAPTIPGLDPQKDPKGVLDQAIKAYEGGKYGEAASILATDLQANPDDGTVHYYLGLAFKKQGYDMKALHELEKAARLCPPEMIKRFANEQIGNLDEPEPLEGAAKPAVQANGSDWLSNIGNGISQIFGAKPAPPAGATGAAKSENGTQANSSGSASGGAANSPLSFLPAMPDVMGQIKEAVKQGKKMLKSNDKESAGERRHSSVDFSRRQAGEAEVMHMADMQDLVQKSHGIHVADWSSSNDGLTAFEQAPENTPEWDYWIGRFKRSFQHVLMRRLSSEAGDEARGAAACIFSVDRNGNLRGQVYASTADQALNKCLVESIRDLNHSRILAFPTTSHITGWNFQMSWNFGVFLPIVRAYKQKKENETTVQALMKMVQEDTSARIAIDKDKEMRARAKKLAAEKSLKAKLSRPEPVAKAEVAARILTPAAERELHAVALELHDLRPVQPNAPQPNVDPFANIDDQTINSWPDLNR